MKTDMRWNYEKWPKYDGDKFAEVKALCDNGSLVRVDDTFLVWEMPVEFLSAFQEIYILTYLFKGSLLSAYLDANGMKYDIKTLDADRNLVDIDGGHERSIKARLRELVTVVDDPELNAVGKPVRGNNPLSKNWFEVDLKRDGGKTAEVQRCTYNFFFNHARSKSRDNMWACFKSFSGQLKGKGYTKGWTPVNLRATNDYIERKHLAYLANIFMRPRLVQYFKDCGVEPNQDLYALSQLVQWVWRSQIRRGDPITVYLPAERMRELFLKWLGSGIDVLGEDCPEDAENAENAEVAEPMMVPA